MCNKVGPLKFTPPPATNSKMISNSTGRALQEGPRSNSINQKTSEFRLSQESRCLKACECHTVTRARNPTAKSHKQKHIRNIADTLSIVASAWWSAQGASLDQVFFSGNRDFCAFSKTDDQPGTFCRNVFDTNIK